MCPLPPAKPRSLPRPERPASGRYAPVQAVVPESLGTHCGQLWHREQALRKRACSSGQKRQNPRHSGVLAEELFVRYQETRFTRLFGPLRRPRHSHSPPGRNSVSALSPAGGWVKQTPPTLIQPSKPLHTYPRTSSATYSRIHVLPEHRSTGTPGGTQPCAVSKLERCR